MSTQATYTLKEAAQRLGIGPRKFNAFLREHGVLKYEDKYNVPTQKTIDHGYMLKRLSNFPHPVTKKLHSYALVTNSGLLWLEKFFDEKYPSKEKAA